MNKLHPIAKKHGFKSNEDFYKVYPTEEHYKMTTGGSLSGEPFNGQPTAEDFFSAHKTFGQSFYKEGGENQFGGFVENDGREITRVFDQGGVPNFKKDFRDLVKKQFGGDSGLNDQEMSHGDKIKNTFLSVIKKNTMMSVANDAAQHMQEQHDLAQLYKQACGGFMQAGGSNIQVSRNPSTGELYTPEEWKALQASGQQIPINSGATTDPYAGMQLGAMTTWDFQGAQKPAFSTPESVGLQQENMIMGDPANNGSFSTTAKQKPNERTGEQKTNMMLLGMAGLTNFLKQPEYLKNDKRMAEHTRSDYQFAPVAANAIGNMGDYNWTGMSEGMLRPDQYNVVQNKGQAPIQVAALGGVMNAGLGQNLKNSPWHFNWARLGEPGMATSGNLQEVPASEANVEVEDREIVIARGKGGIPDAKNVIGLKHSEGGFKANLAKDDFVFSNTASMKIKDPEIHKQFNLPVSKSGYTPAELVKKYQTHKLKGVLADKNSDDIQINTAEKQLSDYNLQFAKASLTQESLKGFPQGIPLVANPYLEQMQINPAQFIQMNPGAPTDTQDAEAMAQYGRIMQDGGIQDAIQKQKGIETWKGYSGKNDPSTGYWDRVAGANLFRRSSSDAVDPRLITAFEKMVPFYGAEAEGVGDYLKNLFTMPQNEMNNLLTGYYESPAQTTNRYHPDMGGFTKGALELGTDPMMIPEIPYAVGKGLVKGVAKVAPPVAKAVASASTKAYNLASKYAMKYLGKVDASTISKIVSRIGQAGLHMNPDATVEDVNAIFEKTNTPGYNPKKEVKNTPVQSKTKVPTKSESININQPSSEEEPDFDKMSPEEIKKWLAKNK